MDTKTKLLLLLDEMQSKANNNPEHIKTSTFEIFIEELFQLVDSLPDE